MERRSGTKRCLLSPVLTPHAIPNDLKYNPSGGKEWREKVACLHSFPPLYELDRKEPWERSQVERCSRSSSSSGVKKGLVYTCSQRPLPAVYIQRGGKELSRWGGPVLLEFPRPWEWKGKGREEKERAAWDSRPNALPTTAGLTSYNWCLKNLSYKLQITNCLGNRKKKSYRMN